MTRRTVDLDVPHITRMAVRLRNCVSIPLETAIFLALAVVPQLLRRKGEIRTIPL